MFLESSHTFLLFVEAFWYNKMNEYGVYGLEKPEIIEFGNFGVMKSGFYHTNVDQINSGKWFYKKTKMTRIIEII